MWEDLAAIQGRTLRVCQPPDNGTGREIVYPGGLRPDMVKYISYDTTDFLQDEGLIALAWPADLETSSAALGYVLRDCGREQVFSLRTNLNSLSHEQSQTTHLKVTRANQRAPLIADDFLLCLENLNSWLEDRGVSYVHFPILDPERPCTLLPIYIK